MPTFIGKKVRVLMKGNLHFNGVVVDENENFIDIIDKFNAKVSLNKSSMSVLTIIEEEEENGASSE
jgi:RNase P/RNase MRP subunit p29